MSYHSWRWRFPQRTRKDLPFPVFTPWRWRTNIKLHYRVLDLEDVYDADDFYKAEVTAAPYYEFTSVNEARRKKYQQKARARAERVVAEIDQFRWLTASRKRLRRAEREFDFVFEPYRQALDKKYGWQWRWVFRQRLIAERARTYTLVWQEMYRLAWLKKKEQEQPPGLTARRRTYAKIRSKDIEPEVEPGVVDEIFVVVTKLKNESDVQWLPLARAGKPYLQLVFPEDTVLQFFGAPETGITLRLDRYGFDWKIHKDEGGKHWLTVIFPVPELLNWIRQGLPKL